MRRSGLWRAPPSQQPPTVVGPSACQFHPRCCCGPAEPSPGAPGEKQVTYYVHGHRAEQLLSNLRGLDGVESGAVVAAGEEEEEEQQVTGSNKE